MYDSSVPGEGILAFVGCFGGKARVSKSSVRSKHDIYTIYCKYDAHFVLSMKSSEVLLLRQRTFFCVTSFEKKHASWSWNFGI